MERTHGSLTDTYAKHHTQFDKKQTTFRDPYKKMENTTDTMKRKTKEERQQLEVQKAKLRDYEDDMKRERSEKEREIKRLQDRVCNPLIFKPHFF